MSDAVELWEWSDDAPHVALLLRAAVPLLSPQAIPREYVTETGKRYVRASVEPRRRPDGSTLYLVRMKRI